MEDHSRDSSVIIASRSFISLQIGPIRLQAMRKTNQQIMIQKKKMETSEKESLSMV